MKNSPEKIELQKSRQIPICRATIKPWAGTALQGSIDTVFVEVYETQFFGTVFHQICDYIFGLSFLTTLNI